SAGEVGKGEHSAFGPLRAALATEGHTTESRGAALVMSGFGVRYSAVAKLRQLIIDFLCEQLCANDLNVAIQAARSLHDALRYPFGLVGRPVDSRERASWSPEFVDTLGKVTRVIRENTLDPFVVVELQRSINWHVSFSEDGPPKAAAQATVRTIPQSL